MNTQQFDKIKKALSKKILDENIIEKIETVLEKMGTGQTTVHSYHTNAKYSYNDDFLRMKIDDGYTMFGGGDFSVYWKNDLVMQANRQDAATHEISMSESGWTITTFVDDLSWRAHLTRLYKQTKIVVKQAITKKKSQPKKVVHDVPEEVLAVFKINFKKKV